MLVLGILTYLFFRHYNGSFIPYPIVWYFGAILMILIGILLIKSAITKGNKEIEDNFKKEIEKFKLNSEKIPVDLNNCLIKTNNYTEQIEKESGYRAQTLDALYDSSKNVESVNVYNAVLIFETEINGQKEKFYSPTINKEEITLRFLLDRQKETFIYVDKGNRKRYYFDIEFLDDK